MNHNPTRARRASTRIRILVWASHLAIAMACLLPNTSAATNDPPTVDPHLEHAILSEDWQQVADLLRDVGADHPSPVLRLVKGHACLALNRNNESLSLFASAAADSDLSEWKSWSDALATRHGQHAVAWYFKGDAHARLREWEAAAHCFDHALELDPGGYLVWNARGVVAHAVGNTLMARANFSRATRANERFADAYASRGTLNVYMNSVRTDRAAGPEDLFAMAKQYSVDEDPLISMIGAGCMHFGKRQFQEARQLFDTVPEDSDLALLARRNALAVGLEKLLEAFDEAHRAGTFLQRMELFVEPGDSVVIQVLEPPEPIIRSVPLKWRIKEIHVGFPILVDIVWEPDPPQGRSGGEGGGNTGSGTGGDAGGDTGGAAGRSTNGDSQAGEHQQMPSTGWPPSSSWSEWIDDWGFIVTRRPREGSAFGDQPVLADLSAVTRTLDAVNLEIQRQAATTVANRSASAQTNPSPPLQDQNQYGGVDADVTRARANRGDWTVSGVYGLLYPVPTPPFPTVVSDSR